MDNRVVRVVLLVAAMAIALAIGAVAGGAAVYALTRSSSAVTVNAEAVDPAMGVIVAAVQSPGPASEAGVVRGDIIQAIDGEQVKHLGDLDSRLGEHEPGDRVALQVLHGDDVRTLEVTLDDIDGKGHLGLMPCGALPWEDLTRLGVAPGVVVLKVLDDTPADLAGVQPGDVILRLEGRELDHDWDLAEAIASYEPGDTIRLDIERQGEGSVQLTLELSEHPEEEGAPYLGLTHAARPHRLTQWEWGWPPGFDFEEQILPHLPGLGRPHFEALGVQSGVLVALVDENGPAQGAGLESGDIITAVDGELVATPKELREAIQAHQPGDQVMLAVCSPPCAEAQETEVTLEGHPNEEGVAYLGVHVAGTIHTEHPDGDGPHRFDFYLDPQEWLPHGLPRLPKSPPGRDWMQPFLGKGI